MRLVILSLIQVVRPISSRRDVTFAIKMNAPSPMALDVVTLSNNAIMDPESGRTPPRTTPGGEWMKRNIAWGPIVS
jgi:hypothetical protein